MLVAAGILRGERVKMAYDERKATAWAQAFLPEGAELIRYGQTGHPMWVAADFDGDGRSEIAAAYRKGSDAHVLVLKAVGADWRPAADLKGNGYSVSTLQAAPVTGRNRMDLVVGWQVGAIGSELSVYDWQDGTAKDVAPAGVSFTYVEAADLPGAHERDGIAELALWAHDTGEAYHVDVYRLQEGELVPAYDVYPYYFPKVAQYYERLAWMYPGYSFYGEHLQEARNKARQSEAGDSAQSGELMRAGELYPAAEKTKNGTKWGYINLNGKMIISPQYDEANPFQDNGLAIVSVDGRSGAIDRRNQYRVKPKFDSISPFTEGRAIAIDRDGFKVIDEQGSVLTAKAYSFISPYRDGLAMASAPGSAAGPYGYLNLQGGEAIPFVYESAGDFKDGKAVVKVKDGEYALIGRDGNRLHTYNLEYAGGLGEGLLTFKREKGGKYGYMNEQGEVVIAPQYVFAQPFRDGRAVVNMEWDLGDRYGLIDPKGEYVLKPQYNRLDQLGEHRLAVGYPIDASQPFIGSKYAIADDRGRFLTKPVFYGVQEYAQGLASVYDDRNTYFIDTGGRSAPGLPSVPGSGTLTLMGPLIQANVDRRTSYLDAAGRVVWEPSQTLKLRGSYELHELKYKPNRDYLVYYPQIKGMQNSLAQRKANQKLAELSQVKPIGEEQLIYSYTGEYEVAFFRKRLLVLELTGYNYPYGAAHGMPSRIYPHVDLQSGRFYELKDLFKTGADYVKTLSAIIGEQIRTDPKYDYVFPDSYKGIAPNQPFYVKGDALYIYFNPYDIAPYAAGFPTFRIPYSKIRSILGTDKPFWKAFHR
ncbi:WG repeat-containing protein [Paenibacillus validus]|uniref:WG repeat-containing protein n=1 Tax=Paenibacillus validus TaxID=44253 RepID=UPI003D26F3A5